MDTENEAENKTFYVYLCMFNNYIFKIVSDVSYILFLPEGWSEKKNHMNVSFPGFILIE